MKNSRSSERLMRNTARAAKGDLRKSMRPRNKETSGLLEPPLRDRILQVEATLIEVHEVQVEPASEGFTKKAAKAKHKPHLRASRLLDNDVAATKKLREELTAHPTKKHNLAETTTSKSITKARNDLRVHVLPRTEVPAARSTE